MKGGTLVVLLVAVLAVGAFLWWDLDRPGSDERRTEAAQLLPGFDPDSVVAVEIETDAGGRVRLRRTAEAWVLEAPQRLAGERGDASAVDELLAALAELTPERTVEPGDEPEPGEVGLGAPRARVVLEREEAPPLVLELGADVPAARTLVARVTEGGEPGETTYHVLDRALLADLERDEWRDRALFPYTRGEVMAVTLEGPQGRVELARRDGGPDVDGFVVRRPFTDLAEAEQVDALLGALEELAAESFVDEVEAGELAGLGLDPPLGTVTVRLSPDGFEPQAPEGADPAAMPTAVASADLPETSTLAENTAAGAEPVRIRVGMPGPDGAVALAVGDQVVRSRSLLSEVLSFAPAAWASHRLTQHRAFDVVGFAVEDATGDLEFERRQGEWSLEGEPATYLPLSDLLNALTEARAAELDRGGDAGPVERTFRLQVENGAQRVEEIRFHARREAAPANAAAGDAAGGAGVIDDHRAEPPGEAVGRVPITIDGREAVFLLSAGDAAEIEGLLEILRAELAAAVAADAEEGPARAAPSPQPPPAEAP